MEIVVLIVILVISFGSGITAIVLSGGRRCKVVAVLIGCTIFIMLIGIVIGVVNRTKIDSISDNYELGEYDNIFGSSFSYQGENDEYYLVKFNSIMDSVYSVV